MSENPQIPLPIPTSLSAPHWEGGREGKLRIQRCRSCGEHIFIPQPACTQCLSGDLDWVESTGKGSLYSFQAPYVVIIVKLEEGFFMLSNLIDCDEPDIEIGMPLEVAFEKMSDDISLPYFRPPRDSA